MTRRALILVSIAAVSRADSADEVWDLAAAMSSALSEGNVPEFLHAFDSAMPGYQHINEAVAAAVSNFEIETAVDLVSNDGDDSARTLVADWQFTFVPRGGSIASNRRRDRVTFKLKKQGKRWRVVSLEPQSAFDPPR